MVTPLLGLTLVLTAADWFGLWRNWGKAMYFIKPAVLLAMIAWSYQLSGWQGAMAWFGAGLVFSLAGDILLMWPKRWFLAGMLAFMCAHLAYIVGFNQTFPPLQPAIFLLLLVAAVPGFLVMPTVLRSMSQKAEHGYLRIPVLIYSLEISLMLFSALLCLLRPDWPPGAAWLAVVGAALFFTSDSLLAYRDFVRPFPHGVVWVHVTYHLGQLLLIAGALLSYAL
jgi:alkenylglycerophosphocholine hydrolase